MKNSSHGNTFFFQSNYEIMKYVPVISLSVAGWISTALRASKAPFPRQYSDTGEPVHVSPFLLTVNQYVTTVSFKASHFGRSQQVIVIMHNIQHHGNLYSH